MGPGMKDYHTALVYGTFSALTLPIGAICGIMTTLPQSTIAMGIAFGAGALLFAVTVELYGSAIERLERKEYGRHNVAEILTTVGGAVIGAVVYILLCRWLDKTLEDFDLQSQEASPIVERQATTPGVDVPDKGRSPRYSSGARSGRLGGRGAASDDDGDDDDYDSARVRVRGRKRAVLGVLQPGQMDKAVRRAMVRDSHTPSDAESGYGTLATRAPGRCEAETSAALAREEQRMCSAARLNDMRVAGGIWLGVLLDGIPEAIMLGYLAAEYKLTFALVAALLIANFPESFSSAALLHRRGVASWKILAMWFFLCVFTGVIACATAYCLPSDLMSEDGGYKDKYLGLRFTGALVEGMAGGAMLACISNIMLPEAFKHRGDMAGMWVLAGFLVAVMIKVFGGVIQERIVD